MRAGSSVGRKNDIFEKSQGALKFDPKNRQKSALLGDFFIFGPYRGQKCTMSLVWLDFWR